MNTQAQKERTLPDLTPSQETIDFLARILLGGGAENHVYTNGKSLRVSDALKSGNCGFMDSVRYPELHGLKSE